MSIEYNALLEEWKGHNKNNYQKNIRKSKILRKNSKELVEILDKNIDLNNTVSVLELGCGQGRNLHYLISKYPHLDIYGNDLIKEECFKYMHDHVKEKIHFYEEDTKSFLGNNLINIDIIVVSDHFMHINPDVFLQCADILMEKWESKFILIRDCLTPRLDKGVKRWSHNMDVFKKKYDFINDSISAGDKNYRIILGRSRI